MPNEQNGYCGPHSSPGDSGSSRESAETVRYQRRPGEHLGKGPYSGPIPRIRAKQLNHYNNQYETCSPTVRHKRNSRRLDTFGENAIETKISADNSFARCLLHPATHTARHLSLSAGSSSSKDSVPSNILVDIDKPEGIATFPKENSDTGIIRVKSAASVFIPAMFHSISALAGFWPLIRKKKRCYQVIHILFSVLAILQWFNCIHSVAIEINVYLVQLQDLYQASSYVIYVVLLCAGYFGTIILPSITLCIASFQLIPYSKHGKIVLAYFYCKIMLRSNINNNT
uniref:Transmembrane protein n=1 Tax=Heterorhabditis bacteriophora TaxID=37862 RepID=A0A1I7XPT4_HETBA